MSNLNRRGFLGLGVSAGLGVSLRAAITGLPTSFLLRGEAHASTTRPRIPILASSSQGEPINVCGPGTYDPAHADYFIHPRPGDVPADDITRPVVNGVRLGVQSLSQAAEITLGTQQVQMAACFAALSSSRNIRAVVRSAVDMASMFRSSARARKASRSARLRAVASGPRTSIRSSKAWMP